MRHKTNVLIVGAGPVGLLLARRLRQRNVACTVIEKRATDSSESRSIGIHPTGAKMFDALGLGEELRQHARHVKTGVAHGSKQPLGQLEFFEGILTLSQAVTMKLLDLPDTLRGHAFVSADQPEPGQILATVRDAQNQLHTWQCQWLVGCDGHHSAVRESQKIDFYGKAYSDAFIMGDFPDLPALGQAAHIFVHRHGLVEALPLDNQRRRWVVRMAEPGAHTIEDLCTQVEKRTGHRLAPRDHLMFRPFTAHRYQAETLFRGRVVLAGDAAHVMSPIGGQGMNVGWMDAWELADIISGQSPRTLSAYSEQALRRAKKASQIAEHNMSIGRPQKNLSPLRSLAIAVALRLPAHRFMNDVFTLQRVPFSSDF